MNDERSATIYVTSILALCRLPVIINIQIKLHTQVLKKQSGQCLFSNDILYLCQFPSFEDQEFVEKGFGYGHYVNFEVDASCSKLGGRCFNK